MTTLSNSTMIASTDGGLKAVLTQSLVPAHMIDWIISEEKGLRCSILATFISFFSAKGYEEEINTEVLTRVNDGGPFSIYGEDRVLRKNHVACLRNAWKTGSRLLEEREKTTAIESSRKSGVSDADMEIPLDDTRGEGLSRVEGSHAYSRPH